MSKAVILAKLQVLLDRVRERSGESRPQRGPVEPQAVAGGEQPRAAEPVERVQPAALAEVAAPTAERTVSDESVEVELSTWTPPAPAHFLDEQSVDVEVEVEIDVADAAPAPLAHGLDQGDAAAKSDSESVERLVIAPAADAAIPPTDDHPSDPPSTSSAPPAQPGENTSLGLLGPPENRESDASPLALVDEQSPDPGSAVVDFADESPAPASSRRPVGLEPERLADLAFGTDESEPPFHASPPESGRVPAAAPDDFSVEMTGVRESSSLSGDSSAAAMRSEELVPEETRAVLSPSDSIASVTAEASRFSPSSFVALLDASLAL